jgi:hypothetical protein
LAARRNPHYAVLAGTRDLPGWRQREAHMRCRLGRLRTLRKLLRNWAAPAERRHDGLGLSVAQEFELPRAARSRAADCRAGSCEFSAGVPLECRDHVPGIILPWRPGCPATTRPRSPSRPSASKAIGNLERDRSSMSKVGPPELRLLIGASVWMGRRVRRRCHAFRRQRPPRA